jgi:hypothetical protein
MLIPDCNTEPEIAVNISESPPFKDYFPVGQGEPSLCFGCYNTLARVLKGTPDNTTRWWIVTNTGVKTGSTIVLKTKGGVLKFEMAAPGCSRFSSFTPLAADDVRTIKGAWIKILREPGTGCGIGLEYSTDGKNWTTVNPVNPPTIPDANGVERPVVDCGETMGRTGCSQECIVTAAASPGWTWVKLGSTWYKVYVPD